ncbi:MAG TPA: phosphatidate cytidylyltransferase [Jatrophihabitans sp.]|nr:phosphatidate cytidylyltransferase [Jatrophihabitans sp.]
MTDPDQPRSAGRHGGGDGSGLSAADLIARSRAGQPGVPDRPTRSAHRRAATAELDTAETTELPVLHPVETVGRPISNGTATAHRLAPTVAAPQAVPRPPATIHHLSVVDGSVPLPELADLPVVPARRAGRNLPAAIGVGLGLGALIVATLALYRPGFVYVIALAVAIGVYELVTAIGAAEARPPLVPLLAGTAAMQAAAWFRGPDGLVGALLLTALGLVIWRLADGADGYLRDVAAGQLVALYVPFLAGFAVLMVHAGDGAARIILFILTVVCSDTGGYAVGVVFGKHPMAPTVSPKKSWEGLAGSLLAGSLCGLLLMTLCFHHQWWQGVLFGVAVVVTATLGDLGESMIKRDLGRKDMGRLLPGHGGIMDRLDSLLPCAPVAYLLLAAFLR